MKTLMHALDPAVRSVLDDLPTMASTALARIDEEQQRAFVEEYWRKRKHVGRAYAAWFFLGCHYAYLGKWPTQLIYWLTLGGLWVWLIIDAFRIPQLVRDRNKDIAMGVLRDVCIVNIGAQSHA